MMDTPASTERLRSWLGNQVQSLLSGDRPPLDRSQNDDPGLFGPDSVAWKVHGNASMLIGGVRALLLQTLHPQAMAAVAEHSSYRNDPWGRLHRTGDFLRATTFGSTADAEAAIEQVRRVHRRVVGIGPDGLPYQANDPHLLAWVHASELDSFLRAYQRYGGDPLGAADQDRYVGDMAQVAGRLGVVSPPTDRQALRKYLQSMRHELRGTTAARQACQFILRAPVPLAGRAAYGALGAGAVGLLPVFARRELALPLPPGFDRLAAQPSARIVLRGLNWVLTPPAVAS